MKIMTEQERKCSWCKDNIAKYEYIWGDLGEFNLCPKCAKNMATNLINDLLKD